MASARYWRIYITANNGDSYTAISELEFRAEPGGADLTSPSMTCSQSSNYSDWTAARAVNNSVGSAGACWVTSGGAPPHWVWFDFGSPVSPVELVMWGETGLQNRSPKDFQVQYSDDAVTWTTQISFTGVVGWTDSVRNFPLVSYQVSGLVREAGSPAAGRKVRVYRRDTGAMLGETTSAATTGAYSLTLSYGGEVQVVCLDDAAGTTFNDLIARTTPA